MKTPSLAFDRWDYAATKILLVGALIGVPLLVVGGPLLAWATGDPLVWSAFVDHTAPIADPAPREGVDAVWDGTAQLTITDASSGLWLLAMLPGAVVAVVTVLVIAPLLGLVRTVQQGESFTGTAVRRLRLVGLTLLTGPWLTQAAGSAADVAVLDHAFGPPASFSIAITGGALAISALGLTVGVMAEAFRQGVRLRDDVDGLV